MFTHSVLNMKEYDIPEILLLRLIPHIADRIHRNECFRIDLSDIVHELLILIFVHDGDHFHTRCPVISTDYLV